MSYHADFWVAMAAAAPVVLLSHVVLFERSLRLRRCLTGFVTWMANGLGAVLAGPPLFGALSSLRTEHDDAMGWSEVWLLLSVLLLAVVTIATAVAKPESGTG